MKKLFLVLVLATTVILGAFTFTACSVNVTTEDDLLEISKPDVEKDAYLQNDLTLDTNGTYLRSSYSKSQPNKATQYARSLSNMTFEGNGHTITITGESNGKLGYLSNLLFRSASNVTIRNLNVVYDLNVSLSTSSGSAAWGGLIGDADNCTIENCTVTFNYTAKIEQKTDSHGFHAYNFGGLVGKAVSCNIVNCSAVVKTDIIGCSIGGLVGTAKDTTVSYSYTELTLNAHNLEEANVGGLAGYTSGDTEMFACHALINNFTVSGKPQGWRSETANTGMLVATADGNSNIHDCYIDTAKDSVFSAEGGTSGVFKTTVCWGLLCGYVGTNVAIKNVYIDPKGSCPSSKRYEFPSGAIAYLTTTIIDNNKSSKIQNIYCFDFAIPDHFVDSKGNYVDNITMPYSYKDIDFGSEVLGETNYWTTNADGKLVLLPYSA